MSGKNIARKNIFYVVQKSIFLNEIAKLLSFYTARWSATIYHIEAKRLSLNKKH